MSTSRRSSQQFCGAVCGVMLGDSVVPSLCAWFKTFVVKQCFACFPHIIVHLCLYECSVCGFLGVLRGCWPGLFSRSLKTQRQSRGRSGNALWEVNRSRSTNTKLVFVHVAASTARGPEYIDITELRSNTLKTRSDIEDKTFNTS